MCDLENSAVTEEDLRYMEEALSLAREAADADEVPVGALILHRGEVIAAARNTREGSKCATHHAEILAIEEACRVLGGWRLHGCTLYVTLEPCAMCSGAIVNSRISSVYIAAKDKIYGSMGSICSLQYYFPEKPEVFYGLLEAESQKLLSVFFRSVRKKGD